MRLLLSPFSKTKLNVRLTSTSFYNDDEDENDKRKKKYNYNYNYYSDSDCPSNSIYGSDSDCLSDSTYVSDSDFNFNNHIQEEQINEEFDNYNNLYTLIWFDCEDCRNLLSDIKNDGKKISYIDGSYYFFDKNDETNTPIFYKNDELIATDVFSIYEELFYNKIIVE
jgi:hypothetical protein